MMQRKINKGDDENNARPDNRQTDLSILQKQNSEKETLRLETRWARNVQQKKLSKRIEQQTLSKKNGAVSLI